MGWVTRVVGLAVSMPTRKSPARGVIEVAVSVLPEPLAGALVSIPVMVVTSDTTISPLSDPAMVAVIGVEPEVPGDPNPTQSSALPLPDCRKPVTCCQLTPPPATEFASKPAPLEPTETLVPMRATTASPALTPLGRLTDHEDWP